MNSYPRIFVISLARATERRASIQKQMAKYGLPFEFFDAVDGRALSPAQSQMVDDKWHHKRSGPPLSPQLVGAAMSHANLYAKIVTENIPRVIILEDDAILTPHFKTVLDSGSLSDTDENLILLHCYRRTWAQRNFSKELLPQMQLYRFYGRVIGACGYFLQKKAAQALYDIAMPIWTIPDWPMDIGKELDAKGIEPPIVLHGEDHFASQIQEFSTRRIPSSVKLMRLLVLPSLLFPKKYGGYWKSRYAWEAVAFNCRAHLFARKPITHSDS